jgi:Ca2+-binding EF-hand superfamily protein
MMPRLLIGSAAVVAVLWAGAGLAAEEPQAADKPAGSNAAAAADGNAATAAGDVSPTAAGLGAAIFDKLDSNADGQLTADEVPGDKQTLFRRLLRTSDKDNDGKLSRSEFAAGIESTRRQRPLTEKLPDQNPGGPLYQDPEKTFARFDANKDGKIVADEVPDQARGLFERMLARADKDGDGAITKEELTAAVNALKPAAAGKPGQLEPAKMFDYLDKNSDGKLSADEIPEGRPLLAQVFKRGDKDGDGTLSREEFLATITALRNLQQQKPNGGQSNGGQPQDDPAKAGRPDGSNSPAGQRRTQANGQRVAKRFAKMDADHDGKISQAEFAAVQNQRFEKIDSNGDGYLEPSEIRQHAVAAGQNAGGRKPNRSSSDRKPPAEGDAAKANPQPGESDAK